jgi:16S rRNA (adenine1518-N6/adenine1519-N6)-dimethyltransferase
LFTKLVRAGFSQRRKQLHKLLSPEMPNWDQTAATLGFSPKARAEELSLQQWIGLTNLVWMEPTSEAEMLGHERFPVVDEMDRILRYAYRAEVHGNNLRHRAAHIFVFDKTGRLYLQKRSRAKDRYPLRWDSSAGGHVSAGEGYDETAQRELREELRVALPLERICKLPASTRTDQEFIFLYRGLLDGQLRPNPKEIEAGAFFAPDIIDGWVKARAGDFSPAFLECWKAYREKEPRNAPNEGQTSS